MLETVTRAAEQQKDVIEARAKFSALKLANNSATGEGVPIRKRDERLDIGLSPNTSSLLEGSLTEDEKESAMRQCFSDAFENEVEYLTSLNVTVTKERQQQILADILVWAEVTQQHYDTNIRSFVLEPNNHDEAFQRVGRFFKEAKQRRGV